jgi:hypothetical protein
MCGSCGHRPRGDLAYLYQVGQCGTPIKPDLAIAIAIHDTVGAWVREWPFTPERVLRAIGWLPQAACPATAMVYSSRSGGSHS